MSDYTDGILNELRKRLELVKRRIQQHECTQLDDMTEWMFSAGNLNELRSEQLFLAGMIEQIERVTA